MDKSFSNYLFLTLLCIFFIKVNNAQEFSDSGVNIGLKIGGSRLLGEIKNDFSTVINEFDNKFGIAGGFEISKHILSRLEIGGEIDFSMLNGNTFTPEFSAEGIQYGIPSNITDPVEYKNNLLGFNFMVRYFFKNADSESKIIPFIRAGAGYLNYYSKFKYIDSPDDELIFGKGTEGYTTLSTPVFFIGTGFKTSLSQNFYLITSIDFNLVNYDFLDVMHNYHKDNTRIELTGLYTSIKVGIFYQIDFSGTNKTKQKSNKNGKSSSGNHLPFSR